MAFGKWLGVGIGWALGGPLGGLVGLLTIAVASVDAHSATEADIDSRLLVSMLAGAERIAQGGMP